MAGRITVTIERPADVGGWLRWASLALAAVGLVVSLYLTWIKLAQTPAFCGNVGDCESVNASIYSEIRGVPVAALGAGAYLLIGLLLLLERRGPAWAEWAPMGVFGLALAGTIYSAYLTYIEIAVLKAICPYCVVSAIAITLLCAIGLVRLWRASPGTDT